MVILRVACDNLYMFKNFEVDFTYERKIQNIFTQNDNVFGINVRKNLLIMGGNSSGKTTFGKLLCMILNFIYGTVLDDSQFKLQAIQYDKSHDSNFEIEFVVDDTVYLLKAIFKNFVLYREEVRMQPIRKSYGLKKLRERLYSKTPEEEYNADIDGFNVGFRSYAFSVSKNPDSEHLRAVSKKSGFWFKFSEPLADSLNSLEYSREIDIEFLGKILPEIDTSIAEVVRLDAKGKKTNSYRIIFKNGEILTVPEGDLNYLGKRLSHGTFEAIDFISNFKRFKFQREAILYVDEKLSHMHSELEKYLAYQAFFSKSASSQLFFTTHNADLLDLDVPVNFFMFFKRNAEGFNEVVFPSSFVNKNDRNIRNYYENDYFNVLPDYSGLDEFFED